MQVKYQIIKNIECWLIIISGKNLIYEPKIDLGEITNHEKRRIFADKYLKQSIDILSKI